MPASRHRCRSLANALAVGDDDRQRAGGGSRLGLPDAGRGGEPVHHRHLAVDGHGVDALVREQLQRLLAVGREHDLVAPVAEHDLDEDAVDRVDLGDEDLRPLTDESCLRRRRSHGDRLGRRPGAHAPAPARRRVNVLPTPDSLVAVRRPSIARTRRSLIGSPRPEPPKRRVVDASPCTQGSSRRGGRRVRTDPGVGDLDAQRVGVVGDVDVDPAVGGELGRVGHEVQQLPPQARPVDEHDGRATGGRRSPARATAAAAAEQSATTRASDRDRRCGGRVPSSPDSILEKSSTG